MKTSRLGILLTLLAALAGCNQGLGEDGGGGDPDAGGDTATSGTGAGGDAPLVGLGGVTPEDATGSDASTGSQGLGGSDGQGGASGSGGGASGSGGAAPDCETCCEGPRQEDPEPDLLYIRVDDSSSFASPLLTRALLDRWDGVRPLPVRAHEFLNFYPPYVATDDSGASFFTADGAIPITTQAMNRVFSLEVAVRHAPLEPSAGRTIALVVDTSPSAASAVDELLGSVEAVLKQANVSDVLGVYTWSPDPQARVIRPFAPVQDADAEIGPIRESLVQQLALRDESASLGTSLVSAIDDAHAQALGRGGEGTIVLVSDGSAGIDVQTLEDVGEAATFEDGKVRVIGVGVGDALYYSDEVLDRITDASGGAYLYFDGSPEAKGLLGERFRELSEVAAYDVRLRLDLPDSVTLVKADGASADIGTADEVIGQNIGWGGTMTFHQALEWTGAANSECDVIHWHVVRGRAPADQEEHLASGSVVVGDVFAGEHATDAVRQSAAVVAAADALRGPTQERMKSAIGLIGNAHAGLADPSRWETSGLPALCETVLRACETKGFACGSCDFDNL